MYCLEINNLVHQFSKKHKVLNNINLRVEEKSIYGFLGPNGAGKTTTLKLILGLLKKQQGEIFIFEQNFEQNRVSILKNIGSLIDSPSFYGHLTAKENLLLLQKIYQCPKERITEVLSLVGLSNTGNKKAIQFSLGMKQRLGIAISLLHNPSLLILDEPTNGLDPNGMIEIRELLTKLNRQHEITIIISSHLLAELEKLVTHVGVINKGKMMFQGLLNDLKNQEIHSSSVSFDTNDIERTVEIIKSYNLPTRIDGNRVVVSSASKKIAAELNRQLIINDVEVFEMSFIKNDLESIFMNLVNNRQA